MYPFYVWLHLQYIHIYVDIYVYPSSMQFNKVIFKLQETSLWRATTWDPVFRLVWRLIGESQGSRCMTFIKTKQGYQYIIMKVIVLINQQYDLINLYHVLTGFEQWCTCSYEYCVTMMPLALKVPKPWNSSSMVRRGGCDRRHFWKIPAPNWCLYCVARRILSKWRIGWENLLYIGAPFIPRWSNMKHLFGVNMFPNSAASSHHVFAY